MTIADMLHYIAACTYKPGWSVTLHDELGSAHGVRPYIQISATTPCSVSGKMTAWKSGKHYLTFHMCRQEVIAAVYAAIEQAELHEVREFFRYKGACIFSPHLDLTYWLRLPAKLARLTYERMP